MLIEELLEMDSNKKIFIVDDHRIFREGLHFLISQMEGYEIAGEASDGPSFFQKIDETKIDIVLMDIKMPGMDGVAVSSAALQKYPGLKIIILTMSCDTTKYNELIKAGVKGFILKESGKEELQKALDSVSRNERYYSQKLLQKMIVLKDTRYARPDRQLLMDINLTKAENDVLKLICEGYSIAGISEKLSISVRMVESYKTGLMAKTGSKNPINLAVFALKNHLVDF